MSVCLQAELWVVVEESERPNAPFPRPLSSGFSKGTSYRVLGLHCPSETSEAYMILCNDRSEIWFISNQHFRVEEGDQYSRRVEQRWFSRTPLTTITATGGHPRYDLPTDSRA